MIPNQDHQTESTDHQCIVRSRARSREGMRAPKILPPGPDHPAKLFDSTSDASVSALASAATDETNAHTHL